VARRLKDRITFDWKRDVNWLFVAVVVMLLVLGSIVVQSAVMGRPGGSGQFQRHLVGIALGGVLLAFFWAFDHKRFKDLVWPLFIFDALLILSPRIPGLGYSASGATSWLAIGDVRLFQPSEPAKLVTILLLAAIISRYGGKMDSLRDYLKVLALSMVPVALILLQPDLGTGLVFIAIAMGMLFVGGAKVRWILTTIAIGLLLVAGLIWADAIVDERAGADKFVKDYQMNRLLVFIDQDRDPTGAGYNLKQSKIAIGSGGLTGRGLGSGTQGNLNFLPERHTDFIFAVLAEELGFVGVFILLGLYLALMMSALNISVSADDLFGTLAGVGIISMWLFQILENIGMTVGLMPITGIPLPFMSFGASFMVTNLAAIGVLFSIWTRRPFRSTAKGV